MSRARARQNGRVDTLDLVIGLVLLLGLPGMGFIILRGLDVDERSLRESVPTEEALAQEVAPTRDEVQAKLEYIRRLYHETARPLINRAAIASDAELLDALRWAHRTLQGVRSEILALQGSIDRTKSAGDYATALAEFQTILASVQTDEARLRQLDTLGVFRPTAGGG